MANDPFTGKRITWATIRPKSGVRSDQHHTPKAPIRNGADDHDQSPYGDDNRWHDPLSGDATDDELSPFAAVVRRLTRV